MQFPKEINFGCSLYGLLERVVEGNVLRGAKADRKGFTTNVVNESFVFTTFLICAFLLITIKGIRDGGSTADFRILFEILKFKNFEI